MNLRTLTLSLVTVSILQAGVLDGIFAGSAKVPTGNSGTLSGIFSGNTQMPNAQSLLQGVGNSAVLNLAKGGAGLLPQSVMGMCYDYKPTVSTSDPGICSLLNGDANPCAKAPDLSLYGYTKKKQTPMLKSQIDSIRAYCDKVVGTTVKKATLPQAISSYKASNNTKSKDVPNYASIYNSDGILGWNNIKAYSVGQKDMTNNYYLYKAVSNNDYLSFQYYQDVLENSVGTGTSVRSKVNVFSPKELQAATVSYNSIKDYNDDVHKIAQTLHTSTGQASSVRVSSVTESEMIKAELQAQASGGDATKNKEGILNSKLDSVTDSVDQDTEYKIRFYKDITVNPSNRIVYPAKGYVESLPPEKKVIAVKKIEIQAKKDAMLEASFREIGEMRKELARLILENANISSRQFNYTQAQNEINALIK